MKERKWYWTGSQLHAVRIALLPGREKGRWTGVRMDVNLPSNLLRCPSAGMRDDVRKATGELPTDRPEL
jgi:hypothetical protein